MPMRMFIVPREIYYGWGALEALKGVKGERALIVTGPRLQKMGHVDRVEAMLNENGIETRVFSEVEPEPSKETVVKIATLAQEFQPDLLIGLGGGSNIDAGKAAWAFYENPDLLTMAWSDVRGAMRRVVFRRKARYVAIPTTSGTASEVTSIAVITDKDVYPAVKTALRSAGMVPDMAIVDAELAATMPPHLTADTGFDALTHAVECYVLTPPSDVVDGLAVRATQTVLSWLPKAVADGQDKTAREKMHMASTMAGMAFSNGRLGLVHACGHQLESSTGISHGRSLALLIDYALAYLFPSISARIGELAQALGLDAANDKEAAERLIAWLARLRKEIGIPSSIKETGIDEAKFMANLDKIAENAIATGIAPKEMTPEEVKAIYLKAWEGAKVQLP